MPSFSLSLPLLASFTKLDFIFDLSLNKCFYFFLSTLISAHPTSAPNLHHNHHKIISLLCILLNFICCVLISNQQQPRIEHTNF
jgi:hypothetical protein